MLANRQGFTSWCVALLALGYMTAAASTASGQDLAGQKPSAPSFLGGDDVADLIVTPNTGAMATSLIDGATLGTIASGYPFGDYAGGVRGALGDLTGDGVADIVLSMGPGGGLVTLLNGANAAPIGGGLPFGAFGGGVNVALGHFDGDGRLDIVTAQATGGGTVTVFNGVSYAPILSLRPFGDGYAGGVNVATGDVDGDGLTDLVVGQAAGPAVSIIAGATRTVTLSGVPFGRNGVFVAAGDVNGDGRAEVIASPAQGAGSVLVFDVRTLTVVAVLSPYSFPITGGLRVASGDLNDDGRADIITVPGPGSSALVQVIDGATLTPTRSVQAFPATFLDGAFIAVTQPAAIRFTSAATATFTLGTPSSFTVRVTGGTGVALTSTGALPSGVTFSDNGNGTATLSGTPVGSGASYPLTISARMGSAAPVVQAFALIVREPASITSTPATTFTAGTNGSFTVAAAGFPVPTLSVSGALPSGITFTPAGNGTATLAGTPASGTGGTYALTIAAANGGAPSTQSFTLTVNEAPRFTSEASTAFTVGAAGTFTVATDAFPDATVSISTPLPSGVSFTPHLDGSATLAGTPAASTGGTYPLTFSATNGIGGTVTQSFTLTIRQAPTFSSPASTGFTVGTPGSFTVTAQGTPTPTVSVSGSLPAGVTFTPNSNGTGSLTGTPAQGTAGTYNLVMTASNGVGAPATQPFTLSVAGSLLAVDDTFTGAIGNTQFGVGVAAPATPAVIVSGSVLDNDIAIATPLTLAVTVPPDHGQVSLNSNGTFLYTPSAGYAGPSDTFTYRLTDANGVSGTATVTIGLSNIVWYVNASAAGGGSGRSHAPFTTIAAALAVSGTGPIHVASGSYAGPLTLAASQRIWGAGSAFVLGGLTIPGTANPVVSGTITLSAGAQLNTLTINGGSGTAVAGGAGVTGTVTLTGVSITGGATGLSLTNVPGNVLVNGGAFSGVTGPEVVIDGGTGTATIGAVISNTAGRSVEVRNRTAGTVSFTAAITDTAMGVFLDSNTGSTVSFTGGLDLVTTGNEAFVATGGGTVTVTQDNSTIVNTITTTTATALRIENTNIGAAGVTFRSITAGTASDTPGVGIVVDDTGSAGGLTVSGNGPLPVGTPVGTAPTGGRIRNKTGSDGSTTSGLGIYLNATLNPTLHWIEVTGFENSGIYGLNVVGFGLFDSLVAGAGTTVGVNEGPIVFGQPVSIDHPTGIGGLSGVAVIRNTVVRNGIENNLLVFNNQAATSLDLRIDRTNGVDGGCQIGPNSTTDGADGLLVRVEGSAAATVTVDQCRMRSNRMAGINATALANGQLTLEVSNSEVNAAEQGTDGVVVSNGGNGTATTTIVDSVFNGFVGNGVRVGQVPLAASATSMLRATVANNTFFHAQGSTGTAIAARLSGSPGEAAASRILIQGNFVSQRGAPAGIGITTPDATATPRVDVTMTLNHVDMDDPADQSTPGARGPYGIALSADQVDPALGMCANIRNNTTHWYPVGVGVGGGILFTRVGSAQVRLERGIRSLGEAFDVVLRENNVAGPAGASAVTVAGTFPTSLVVENNSCQVP